jgi:hypothetical protein
MERLDMDDYLGYFSNPDFKDFISHLGKEKDGQTSVFCGQYRGDGVGAPYGFAKEYLHYYKGYRMASGDGEGCFDFCLFAEVEIRTMRWR